MPRIFIAPDGSWGDADFIRIVDITDEEARELHEMSDSEIHEFAAGKEKNPDFSAHVELDGVEVTICRRTEEMNEIKGTEPGTLLVQIDTSFEKPTTIAVDVNEDRLWEGSVPA